MKKLVKALAGIALALSFAVVPSAINSGDSSTVATVSASVVHQEKINLTGMRIVGKKVSFYHLTEVRVTTDKGNQYYSNGKWYSNSYFTYIY